MLLEEEEEKENQGTWQLVINLFQTIKKISYLEYSEESIRTITNSFNNYIDLFSKIRNNIFTINEINNGELISIVLKQLDDGFNIRLIEN